MTTTHLQGIGRVPAKRTDELELGDRVIWNYGYIETVTAIERTSARFFTVTLERDGQQWTRRMRDDRLVGFIPEEVAR